VADHQDTSAGRGQPARVTHSEQSLAGAGPTPDHDPIVVLEAAVRPRLLLGQRDHAIRNSRYIGAERRDEVEVACHSLDDRQHVCRTEWSDRSPPSTGNTRGPERVQSLKVTLHRLADVSRVEHDLGVDIGRGHIEVDLGECDPGPNDARPHEAQVIGEILKQRSRGTCGLRKRALAQTSVVRPPFAPSSSNGATLDLYDEDPEWCDNYEISLGPWLASVSCETN
jgi:hypothetical protein